MTEPQRGFGWLPDPEDERDRDHAVETLSLSAAPPTASALVPLVQRVEQGSTSSCVANALAMAIYVAKRARGEVAEIPSRLFGYYYARFQHAGHLVDDGTYIRLGVKAFNALGTPPEKVWPFVPERINTKPPPQVDMEAFDHKRIAYHRITGYGSEAVREAKEFIADGMGGVVFGTDVGDDFWRNGDGLQDVPTDRIVGGHAMFACAYDEQGFIGPQSWDDDWGNDGWFHITEEYFAWHRTRDRWGVKLLP